MDILIPILIVSGIGLVVGVGLAVASSIFAVPKNEIEEKVRECLPGANCGACGFSGCDGYAQAIAKGETDNISLCLPGGNETVAEIAAITGKAVVEIAPVAAFVKCNGTCANASDKLEYSGIKTCKAANMMLGGEKTCRFGCLGYGDCMAVCDNGAITLCDGVARIDVQKCGACQKCAQVCPKHLIDIRPVGKLQAVVMCASQDKGPAKLKACKASCIGCGKCTKACAEGAITVESFVAKVDAEKCTGCGECAKVCPRSCIVITE